MKHLLRAGIYRATNLITGQFYIGASNKVSRRWVEHIQLAESDVTRTKRKKLHNNMRQYGHNNFHVEMIEDMGDWRDFTLNALGEDLAKEFSYYLSEREQHYFDTLKPDLNDLLISVPAPVFIRTEASRKRMSDSKFGHKQSIDQIEKRMLHIRGVPKTKEHTAKTQETKLHKYDAKVSKQAENNKKDKLIKNDVRHMLRQLTDDQIRYIRQGGKTNSDLALEFGVSPATIKKIRIYKTYKDVPDIAPNTNMRDAA